MCSLQSPYWIACARGQLQVVQYLALEAKVDTDRPSYAGITPVQAAEAGNRMSTLQWLSTELARVQAEEAQMTAEEIRAAHEAMFGATARRALGKKKMPGVGLVLGGGLPGFS